MQDVELHAIFGASTWALLLAQPQEAGTGADQSQDEAGSLAQPWTLSPPLTATRSPAAADNVTPEWWAVRFNAASNENVPARSSTTLSVAGRLAAMSMASWTEHKGASDVPVLPSEHDEFACAT